MMSLNRVPSERQERVLGQLSNLRASHQSGQVPPSWVVVSSCTTLESATSEKLQALLDDRLLAAGADQLFKKTLKAKRSEMDRSWNTRLEWLADGFNVKLALDDKTDLLAMAYLRNAIAHDGDTFTSQQLLNYPLFIATRSRLESTFALHTIGVRFVVTNGTADAALRVARRVALGLSTDPAGGYGHSPPYEPLGRRNSGPAGGEATQAPVRVSCPTDLPAGDANDLATGAESAQLATAVGLRQHRLNTERLCRPSLYGGESAVARVRPCASPIDGYQLNVNELLTRHVRSRDCDRWLWVRMRTQTAVESHAAFHQRNGSPVSSTCRNN